MGISQATVAGRTVWTHGGTIWVIQFFNDVRSCIRNNHLCFDQSTSAQAFQVSIELLSTLINNLIGINESTIQILEFIPTLHSII